MSKHSACGVVRWVEAMQVSLEPLGAGSERCMSAMSASPAVPLQADGASLWHLSVPSGSISRVELAVIELFFSKKHMTILRTPLKYRNIPVRFKRFKHQASKRIYLKLSSNFKVQKNVAKGMENIDFLAVFYTFHACWTCCVIFRKLVCIAR